MRAENELRAAAARRAAADPFALLCPGRRLVLSLPRRSTAASAHAGSDANPNPSPMPGTPHVGPGLGAASTSRMPGSNGVCAGASMPDLSPGNPSISPSRDAASADRLPASNGACGTSSDHPEDTQAAGNGRAASSARDANGDAPGGGLQRQSPEEQGSASANGAADAAHAPRFAAAVLDAPQAAAAAGARDCAVFIVPQVCCLGPHPD